MKWFLGWSFLMSAVFVVSANQIDNMQALALQDLQNYQVNSVKMLSAGLPNKKHFTVLKELGVRHVVDLIPGDRSEEKQLVKSLNFNYQNIPVDWHNPRLEDFDAYVVFMNSAMKKEGKVLTHCKLNWRGAVFTYLYRVIEMGDAEELAKTDMLAIWKPEGVWVSFIEEIIEKRMAK